MKLALLFSGQLRSFEEGFNYFKKNLLDHYDVDIFFHTWSKNFNSKVFQLYKPKDSLIEDDSIFNNFKKYNIASENHPARSTILSFRSIKYCNLLQKSSNVDYDWIIKTRFDFALNKKINFETLNKQKMYFCDTVQNTEHTKIHDQFVISNRFNIDIYSTVYDNIDKYHDEGCIVNGEDLLIFHLKKHNLLKKEIIEYIDLNPPFLNGLYNSGKHSLIRTDMNKWK